MIGKLDEALRFQQTALSLRAERQQLLASNIANADTPNYKARDIDFNSVLKDAVSRSSVAPTGMVKTASAHLTGNATNANTNTNTTASGIPLLYRMPAQGSADSNTVDMDRERNQFADNALRYEAGITFINGQLKNLLTAVQG